MSLLPDYPYDKTLRSFTLMRGERQEIRKKARFKGKVDLRVTSNNPILLQIVGPHAEQREVHGTHEVSFDVSPGAEILIVTQNKQSFFTQPAYVTIELTMYGSKKACEVLEKVENMLSLLQDSPDFFDIQKEVVKEVLKEAAEIWGHLDEEGKQIVRNLIKLTKQLEEKTTK